MVLLEEWFWQMIQELFIIVIIISISPVSIIFDNI